MSRRRLGTTALTIALTAPFAAADAPPAAEFRDGRWQPVTAPAPAAPAADPELDHVQQLLDHGDGEAALAVGLRWVKTHDKHAPVRDRALYQIARGKYQVDDRIAAYYYLDELMDEYPESRLFTPALDLQYHIADDFLNGHKVRILGLPVLGQEDDAVEMLYRIQQRAPGSSLAERALLRTADYYYASADYDLAHDAYAFYVRTYPRSRRVPQVKLRSAFASLAQFRGPRFDATPMLDARAELSDFVVAYPALAAQENVSGILARIDEELAIKLFLTADFYRRTGATDGAVYMYRYLMLTYPHSGQVPAAEAALAKMPKWALAQAPPRAGVLYTPAASPRPRALVP